MLRVAVACALLLAVPVPLAAQSDAGSTGVGGQIRAIRVVLVGTEPPFAFSERLASWFGPATRIIVRNEPRLDANRIVGPKDQSGVYVWVEQRSFAVARIYFAVSEGDGRQRFVVRDVVLERGLDELGVERLTHVVYSSVVALWQRRIESSQAEVERQLASSAAAATDAAPTTAPANADRHGESAATEPAAAEPAAGQGTSRHGYALSAASEPVAPEQAHPAACPSPHLALGAGYGLNARGDEGPAHGPQLWAALLGGCPAIRLGGYVSARYLIPVDRSANDVAVRLTGGRMRLGGLLQGVVTETFRIEVGAGFGTDIVRYEPSASAGLEARPGETEMRPVATLLVGSRFLAGIGGIALVGELDVQLQDIHYDVSRPAGLQIVLAPWQVQPGFSALMRFDSPNP